MTLPEYMRTNEAAEYIRVSASTLAKLRMECSADRGPVYSKVGGCVIYRRSDLDDWFLDNAASVIAQ